MWCGRGERVGERAALEEWALGRYLVLGSEAACRLLCSSPQNCPLYEVHWILQCISLPEAVDLLMRAEAVVARAREARDILCYHPLLSLHSC